MRNFSGKAAMVTGGGTGIGRAVAEKFASLGADLILLGRRLEPLVATENLIKERYGVKALSVRCDIADASLVDNAFIETRKVFGKLDILINNAAMLFHKLVVDIEDAEFIKVLYADFVGAFYCSKRAVKWMIEERTEGTIVNVSSIHSVMPLPRASAYCSAKGALESFSKCLALEVADYGINVNVVRPGPTYTEGVETFFTDKAVELMKMRIPLRKIAKAEDIANAIVFLSSPQSKYITGSVLNVDGGYLANGSLPGTSTRESMSEL